VPEVKALTQNTAIIAIHALMTRVRRFGNILYSYSLANRAFFSREPSQHPNLPVVVALVV
jgi:hypothetical protein